MYSSLLSQCYVSYRDQIEHEDLLLNQRVTWIVTSQAFLLGSCRTKCSGGSRR